MPLFTNKLGNTYKLTRSFHYEDNAGHPVRLSEIAMPDRKCHIKVAEGSDMSPAIVKFTLNAMKKSGVIAGYCKWVGANLWETEPSVFKVADDCLTRRSAADAKPEPVLDKFKEASVAGRLSHDKVLPTYTRVEQLPSSLRRMLDDYSRIRSSKTSPAFLVQRYSDRYTGKHRFEDIAGNPFTGVRDPCV